MASSSNSGYKDIILNLAKSNGNGITNKDIEISLPGVSKAVWAGLVNDLLSSGYIELLKDKNTIFYKYKDASKKSELVGTDNEEKVVYKIIEKAGNKGIWIRDIRISSNLNPTQLNKILKSLESKKFVKAVKSVAAGKKKVYMLYNLEPDSSITGGAWYQDQDFDAEFVNILNEQCQRFLEDKREEAKKLGGGPILIRNRSYVTASDVHTFISELKISKVDLSVSDIEKILFTLVLDNKAERNQNTKNEYLYKATTSFLPSPGIVKIPCGICPIEKRCRSDTGFVNPTTCQYLSDWLRY